MPRGKFMRKTVSTEVLDEFYKIDSESTLKRIKIMQNLLPKLEQRVADAKTKEERERIRADVNKLTELVSKALS